MKTIKFEIKGCMEMMYSADAPVNVHLTAAGASDNGLSSDSGGR